MNEWTKRKKDKTDDRENEIFYDVEEDYLLEYNTV
jgi:hypothetical protein